MKLSKMKKEQLELLSYKDITDLLLQENGKMNTLEIFKTIVKLLELPESALETKIGDFYTSLATDKRFVMLDGTWDLRSRHTSDKAVISVDEEDEVEELKEESEDADDIVEDDYDSNEDDDYDETEDELKDLVVLDEDELEQ